MDLILKFEAVKNEHLINYNDAVMLIGSCFTEHIGNYLKEHKFTVLQNPNGILFDTLSVCRTLTSYIEAKQYTESELFYYNELWHSWQHHSMYSGVNKANVLQQINNSQLNAHNYLKTTSYLIITLGSSYAYKLQYAEIDKHNKAAITNLTNTNTAVTNCHKAPQQWFSKYLIPIEEQIATLDNVIYRIKQSNPNIKIIFTISPVRHIRDGVVENNRSKARLLETVHHLTQKFENIYYYAAYEMLIDVLRDYRFYDIDMVHPNYSATNYVLEQFKKSCIDETSQQLLTKISSIITARKHKAFNPQSIAHKKFLLQNAEQINSIIKDHPQLNFKDELTYFSSVIV